MPRHHYLPASFLAEFSLDQTTYPRRERQLSVGDLEDSKVFVTSAANVAAVNNLYTMASVLDDPEVVERTWAEYESDLNEAIDLLIAQRLDGRTWIRTLVPFVAAMLVRGPDFDRRFKRRIRALGIDPAGGHVSEDNVNGARLLELQRLLGPVTVAKWTVIHVIGDEPLITNDLGYALFTNVPTNERGIAIPLNPTHVLTVVPRVQRAVVRSVSGRWEPVIDYADNLPGNHQMLNEAISGLAQRFIFGPDDDVVRKYLQQNAGRPYPPEPEQLGFITDPLARAHEFTWHRLAAAIEQNPDDQRDWNFELDWEAIASGWSPPVFFPVNLMEFPPALTRDGDRIIAEFYDPSSYYSLSRIRELEYMEDYESLLVEAEKGIRDARDDDQLLRFLTAKGAALDELERHDEAVEVYDQALEIEDQSPLVITNRSVTLLNKGEIERAMDGFRQALQLDSSFSIARLNLGGSLWMTGDYTAAVDELTRALDDLPPGPTRGAAFMSRGSAKSGLGDFAGAATDFEKAIEEYPDATQKAFCKFKQAVAMRDMNDLDDALANVEAAIDLDDEAPEAHTLRAELLMEQGENQAAIEELERALELPISDELAARAYDYLGRAHTQEGELEDALNEYTQALRLAESSQVHHNYGLTLLLAGDIQDAIHEFSEALRIDPNNAGALNNRGIALAALGKVEEAKNDFEKSASTYADSVEAGSPMRHLGICHLLQGDIERAKSLHHRSSKLDPESPFNRQLEAYIELHEGSFEGSCQLLSELGKEHDDLPDLTIYRSLPLALQGKATQAVEILENCISGIRYKITLQEYARHLRALRDRFPDASQLGKLESVLTDHL